LEAQKGSHFPLWRSLVSHVPTCGLDAFFPIVLFDPGTVSGFFTFRSPPTSRALLSVRLPRYAPFEIFLFKTFHPLTVPAVDTPCPVGSGWVSFFAFPPRSHPFTFALIISVPPTPAEYRNSIRVSLRFPSEPDPFFPSQVPATNSCAPSFRDFSTLVFDMRSTAPLGALRVPPSSLTRYQSIQAFRFVTHLSSSFLAVELFSTALLDSLGSNSLFRLCLSLLF